MGCPCRSLNSAGLISKSISEDYDWLIDGLGTPLGPSLLRADQLLLFSLEAWKSYEFLGPLPELWRPVLWERSMSPCLLNIRIPGPSHSLSHDITIVMKGLGLLGTLLHCYLDDQLTWRMTTESFLAIIQPQLSWKDSFVPYWESC